jgi:8-oxo-dGTP pyrophosphatase MutT (NUDIX family)
MGIPISLIQYDVTREKVLSQHPEYNKVAVGALVFDKQSGEWRLLIIQRASTANSSPGLWEIPGGKLENETIIHGIKRELFEEVGMRVIAFIRLVEEAKFWEVMDELIWCKVSCEVRVESTAYVRLDPAEHQDFLWVTKKELERHEKVREGEVVRFKITEPWHEATMFEGFRLKEEDERMTSFYFVGWVMNIFNPRHTRNFVCALRWIGCALKQKFASVWRANDTLSHREGKVAAS